MTTLTVRPADALDAAERGEIVALCDAAFDEPFEAMFDLLPGSTHVLLRVDGTLVSHAAWVTRWLHPAGRAPLRTAYVEAVATLPGRERRGHGSAVLREVARRVADHDLAALSPSDQAFYARLGWEPWRGPLSIHRGDEIIATPEEEIMILRLPRTPPLDLASAMAAEWRDGELW